MVDEGKNRTSSQRRRIYSPLTVPSVSTSSKIGRGSRIRTYDTGSQSPVLYHLSYTPTKWAIHGPALLHPDKQGQD